MKWQKTAGVMLTAAIAASVWGLPVCARQAEKTSENTPFLEGLLKRRPETDLNRDNILGARSRITSRFRKGTVPFSLRENRDSPPVVSLRPLALEEAQEARREMQDARQRANAKRKPGAKAARKPAPTQANVRYGDHPRHVVDFWQAESDSPTPLFVWIHGGGFRGGDKASIPGDLLQSCLKAGISCASINYRLSHHAPYPAQMHDSARAIQFLRTKASDWNLDPKRFAAGGGSAGSGISQWIGFHDDMARPDSDDPVARQSTRLSCVLPINMQSTYDPREIKRLVPGEAYKHPALLPLFARPQGWDWDTGQIDEALDRMLKDASPINHLTQDDPPVFLIHYERSNRPGNIHHPNFGKHLKEAMDKLGIECVRRMDTDYDSTTAAYADMVEFLKKHLGI